MCESFCDDRTEDGGGVFAYAVYCLQPLSAFALFGMAAVVRFEVLLKAVQEFCEVFNGTLYVGFQVIGGGLPLSLLCGSLPFGSGDVSYKLLQLSVFGFERLPLFGLHGLTVSGYQLCVLSVGLAAVQDGCAKSFDSTGIDNTHFVLP